MTVDDAFDQVSIVMPSFNSAATIADSIDSVRKQSYPNWELLITDDCSSDETVAIVTELCRKDDRIHLERHAHNQGAGEARNTSIRRARGRYIAFLDSDDLWLPSKLQLQIEFMKSRRAALSYTWYQRFDGKEMGSVVKAPATVSFRQLLTNNVIGCLTAVYDVSMVGKVFLPEIRQRQDMALWLRILAKGETAHGLQKSLAIYRTDSGRTSNKLKAIAYQWQLYRSVFGYRIIRSAYLTLEYFARTLLRVLFERQEPAKSGV